ncbi:MAG: TetR/AcrR family transcriptional regulator [Prevotella sp.]|nr:TetR/AcrR family transcriptional regulator [Prevotella sp.]MCM1075580.1 TetR/AcrR family transcriptional regulator [Ruminococcus sp.]
MVLKTRDRLIEVARQLFARKGIENTTMNDIASASDKGRRTIYTYFKNKRDIFNAVVEQETETLLNRLTEIEHKDISPAAKIEQYMVCRFETMREIVSRNGSLKAGFFRDVRKVDRARKTISEAEIEILSRIVRQGIESGQFAEANPEHTATVIVHCIHGLDVPFIRDNLAEHGLDQNTVMQSLTSMILNGIRKRLPCDIPIETH